MSAAAGGDGWGFAHECVLAVDQLGRERGMPIDVAEARGWARAESAGLRDPLERLARVARRGGFYLRVREVTLDEVRAVPLRDFFMMAEGQGLVRVRWAEGARECRVARLGAAATTTARLDAVVPPGAIVRVAVYDGPLTSFLATETPGHAAAPGPGHGEEHLVRHTLGLLLRLVREERRDVGVICVYAVMVALLSLVIPLSTQAVVNAVSLGVFTPNLIVLCMLAFIGLLVLGGFFVMQRYVIDVLQRRLFVRTSFELAYRLPRIREAAFDGEYAPELVNRFFDVLTLQKTIGKVLLDGLSAALTIVLYLGLLAAYHPIFLVFDVIVLLYVPFLFRVLGRGGLATSVEESARKYAVAHWLEEIARCRPSFKSAGTPEFVFDRIDRLSTEYVLARHAHFIVLARQLIAAEVFQAFMTVGVVGLGGVLVIERQLSLGQFVAAEVAVVYLLGSVQKLIAQFEEVYDLLTALHKLATVTEKPLEEIGDHPGTSTVGPASLTLRNVDFAWGRRSATLAGATLEVRAGERVSIVGRSGSGKSSLVALMTRMYEPAAGVIELDGVDVRRLDPEDVRAAIGVVEGRADQLFAGTVEQNVTVGRAIPYAELRRALDLAGLYDEVMDLPNGLATPLPPTAPTVSDSFRRRLLLARAIVGRPRLLVLEDAFRGMPDPMREHLVDVLYREPGWTIVDATQDPRTLARADRIVELRDGRFVEHVGPSAPMLPEGAP